MKFSCGSSEGSGPSPRQSELRQRDGGGNAGGFMGGAYGLGFVGAAVYYIGHAATFGAGVLGFLKALVWPAFLVYHLLAYLNL